MVLYGVVLYGGVVVWSCGRAGGVGECKVRVCGVVVRWFGGVGVKGRVVQLTHDGEGTMW